MPTVNTCPEISVLERLLLGRISEADGESVEAHIVACPRCTAALQQLRVEDPLVEALRHTPPPYAQDNTPFLQVLIPCLKRLAPNDLEQTEDYEAHSSALPAAVGHYDFLAAAQAPDELGRLGGYRVLKVLGEGGMGVVFLADDPGLKRLVALKAIKPQLVRRVDIRERFIREAQAVAKVEHENIVAVFHVAEERGVPFLVMPLLRGESLEERLQRAAGPLSIDETLRIAREIASGLAVAHDHGLIHRDIKPRNIFLSVTSTPRSAPDSSTQPTRTTNEPSPESATVGHYGQGKVKILDFGLARARCGSDSDLSRLGQIIGTPAYMAPEQGRGETVDHRADLFSLGCVLYRMATGKTPFRGVTLTSILLSVAMDKPAAPHELNHDIPPALGQLIERLLAKKPAERPPSAHAVVETIQALERERAEARRPKISRRGVLIGAAAALLVASLLGALLPRWLMNAPPAPPLPGEVAFVFDEPDVQFAVQRDDEAENTIDAEDGLKKTLPPGAYRTRLLTPKEGRVLVPEAFVVKAGEALTVELRLVGQIAKVGGFAFPITGVAASSKKGELLILASSLDNNSALGVWDGKSPSFKFPRTATQQMTCVALAPDGVHAATGPGLRPKPDETAIPLWDVRLGRPKVLERLAGHAVFVKALAFSPDGTRLVSGDSHGKVIVWNMDKLEPLYSLDMNSGEAASVAFSPDGKQGLAGGANLLLLWDAATGKESKRLENGAKVCCAVFGPGMDEATTGGDDGLIRIWSLKSNNVRVLKANEADKKTNVESVAVSPDGKRILSGGEDGAIRLWDALTAQQIYVFKPGDAAVHSVAFTADGRQAVSGGADRTLRLWQLPP